MGEWTWLRTISDPGLLLWRQASAGNSGRKIEWHTPVSIYSTLYAEVSVGVYLYICLIDVVLKLFSWIVFVKLDIMKLIEIWEFIIPCASIVSQPLLFPLWLV